MAGDELTPEECNETLQRVTGAPETVAVRVPQPDGGTTTYHVRRAIRAVLPEVYDDTRGHALPYDGGADRIAARLEGEFTIFRPVRFEGGPPGWDLPESDYVTPAPWVKMDTITRSDDDSVKPEPDGELMGPMYPPQQWWVPVLAIGGVLVAALLAALAWQAWA